jgi:hypothetical protein
MEFKTLEKTIYTVMCQTACQLIVLYMATWDQIIKAQRDIKEYQFHSFKATHIATMFGRVDYKRSYYQKKSGGFTCLLDEAMGMKAGCGMVGENLAGLIVAECADKSFRKAAESISSLTGQAVSRMTAWNVLQQYGEKLEEQEARLEELAEKGVTGQLGNVPCPVVFEEFDDVWLNQQRAQRRKKGEPTAKARRRIGKKPMHVGTAYTGWKQAKDGSYETINKVAHASFGDVGSFCRRFGALLEQFFDMDGVERQVANGDGEPWIKAEAAEREAILQLDPFHRSKAILKAVKDQDDRKAIHDAFKEKDIDKAFDIIIGLIAKGGEEATLKKLAELLTYLDNNKGSLLPWQERGIPIPAPPEGVVYRNLGLQEHNNCDLLTQRMKHRKGSWSPAGGDNMAKILCLRNTVGLDIMFGLLPEVPEGDAPKEALSAAKAPAYDGKGYDGTWLHAALPIEGAFKTLGRDAIRNLVRQRPLADLGFI